MAPDGLIATAGAVQPIGGKGRFSLAQKRQIDMSSIEFRLITSGSSAKQYAASISVEPS